MSEPQPFTPRQAEEISRMLVIRALHKGPACAPIGEWLVKQAKKTWPRFAWFRGPSKTNSARTWTVVSYHHPAQLCWEPFRQPKHFACAPRFRWSKPNGMTLAEYIKRPGALSRSALCEGLAITPGRLSQLRASTEWPPELALKLESLTRGAISASEICPVVARARAA